MSRVFVQRRATACVRHGVLALAAALALAPAAPVRADPIHTGVEKLLWPIAIVAAPFFAVHTFIFGSDDKSREEAAAEAKRILQSHPGRIPVNGIYTGALPLTHALYGILVESRFPWVEIDTAGSHWLLSQARDPRPLIALAQQHRHIRLSIGEAGHPDCFVWNSMLDDLTDKPAVRPGRCLRVSFIDTLASDAALEVDVSQAAKRRLRWVLKDRASGNVHLAVPFWESQVTGKPISVSTTYRARHENDVFIRVLRTMAPVGPAGNPDGSVHLLRETDPPFRRYLGSSPLVQGTMAVLSPDTPPRPVAAPAPDRWEDAYAQAYASGLPVVVNHKLVIDPAGNRFGPACVQIVMECDYSKTFVAGKSLLTVNDARSRPASGSSTSGIPGRPMRLYVMSRDLDDRLEWHMTVVLEKLPKLALACEDLRQECGFIVVEAGMRDGSLVVRGRLTRGVRSDLRLPDHEVEVVASLAGAARKIEGWTPAPGGPAVRRGVRLP